MCQEKKVEDLHRIGIEASIRGLNDYIKKVEEKLISATNSSINNINTDKINDKNEETKMGRKITVLIFQAANREIVHGHGQS